MNALRIRKVNTNTQQCGLPCISSGYSIKPHNTHLLLIGLAPVMSLIDAIRHREPPEQQRLAKYRNVR